MSLRTKDLEVQYRYGRKAIDGININLKKGDKLVILGGECAGKTTLLKTIVGLLPITKGDLFFDNKNINNTTIKDRNFTLLYEDLGLVPKYSLYKNLLKPLLLHGVKRKNADYIIKELAVKYKLDAFLRDKAISLSNINIIRTAILRTELRATDLILIDNTFKQANENRKDIFLELLSSLQNITETLIFATSSIDEAVSLNCPILFLHYGQNLQYGNYLDLKLSPAYLEVDKFFNIKNYLLQDVKNHKITLLGESLELPINEYAYDKVHITFNTILNNNGFPTDVKNKFCRQEKFYIVSEYEDNVFTTNVDYETFISNKKTINIKIDFNNIKFYDYKTEKNINN